MLWATTLLRTIERAKSGDLIPEAADLRYFFACEKSTVSVKEL